MMIRINSYKIFIVVFICCSTAFKAVSQNSSAATSKNHKFTLYFGAGPNYYFNNLVLAKDKVKELSYSFVGRIMWEPKHNLSLGIESGYNRFYSVDGELPGTSEHVHIVNAAIPLRIVVSMKFFENYYANFNMGQSILQNKVSTSSKGTFNASNVSLGDFGLDIGYRRLVSDRFYVGSEIKGTYSAKLEDKNIALVFLGGFRF